MHPFRGMVPAALLGLLICTTACLPKPQHTEDLHDSQLVTMRPREDIPSIHDPGFLYGADADRAMRPKEKVLGFVRDGVPVAISVALLDRHEIVNGDMGGEDGPFVASW